jgi:hypothetical protein
LQSLPLQSFSPPGFIDYSITAGTNKVAFCTDRWTNRQTDRAGDRPITKKAKYKVKEERDTMDKRQATRKRKKQQRTQRSSRLKEKEEKLKTAQG